jgi:hypothetical protein
MIARATGEILFGDGFVITPQILLTPEHLATARAHHPLSMPGWTRHVLGVHGSDFGPFEVEAISDPHCRVHMAMLAHEHAFYEPDTLGDAERRVFHDGVIAKDLAGQREFNWGNVFCRFNPPERKDWLIVVYHLGPQVPTHEPEVLLRLFAHAPNPDGRP